MLYEIAIALKPESTDEQKNQVKDILRQVTSEFKGEVLILDDWGTKTLAWPTRSGHNQCYFVYSIYSGVTGCNQELERKFGIHDSVLRSLIVKKGELSDREDIVKSYKTPFSKTYHGSQTDNIEEEGVDLENNPNGKKRFSRGRSCWFIANKVTADWKDPATFSWLVNEFGKITPARMSNVSRKHQRFANRAIKRARQIGIASNMSGAIAFS
jgi:small subunit ribosomal protein S6